MKRRIFNWFFKSQIEEFNKEMLKLVVEVQKLKADNEVTEKRLANMLNGLDVSVDVDMGGYSKNWAVISLQGQRSDFIKFIDLGHSDMLRLQEFLSRFDRRKVKVDAPQHFKEFLKVR